MPPTLTLKPDRDTLRLSDSLTVSVIVDGDAPLRIDEPKELLAGVSADVWGTSVVGKAKSETLPDGRERWTQQYKCRPFAHGPAVPMEFSPFPVQAGTAIEPVAVSAKAPLHFKVETSLVGAKAEDARPVTGVEELLAPPSGDNGAAALVALLAALLLIASAAAFALVRRRRRVLRVPPATEALYELDRLDSAERPMERIADILRTFIRRRFGLPTDFATTAELLAAARAEQLWTAEQSGALETILSECDRAKFGTDPPDPTTVADVRQWAWEWVTGFSEPEA